jgi:hypothetical protein
VDVVVVMSGGCEIVCEVFEFSSSRRRIEEEEGV